MPRPSETSPTHAKWRGSLRRAARPRSRPGPGPNPPRRARRPPCAPDPPSRAGRCRRRPAVAGARSGRPRPELERRCPRGRSRVRPPRPPPCTTRSDPYRSGSGGPAVGLLEGRVRERAIHDRHRRRPGTVGRGELAPLLQLPSCGREESRPDGVMRRDRGEQRQHELSTHALSALGQRVVTHAEPHQGTRRSETLGLEAGNAPAAVRAWHPTRGCRRLPARGRRPRRPSRPLPVPGSGAPRGRMSFGPGGRRHADPSQRDASRTRRSLPRPSGRRRARAAARRPVPRR